MSTKPQPIADRFWPKVDAHEPHECWLWRGTRNADGYGMLFNSKTAGPRVLSAHRISWRLHHGEIPAGLHVLHRCDNPPCVNPAHLWLGTQADNNRDRDQKGRCGAKGGHAAPQGGEANGNCKLSDEAVARIRARYAAGDASQQQIAAEFGVGQSQVSRIVRKAQRG